MKSKKIPAIVIIVVLLAVFRLTNDFFLVTRRFRGKQP
jgi:hypothetical protein